MIGGVAWVLLKLSINRGFHDSSIARPGGLFGSGSQLYKLASGHGTQCEACHGSTHAEYPTPSANDNVQSIVLQGHAGANAECSVCHANVPLSKDGGPHTMHTIGQTWISRHGGMTGGNTSSCATFHGNDYKGMFLSKASMNRTFTVDGSTKNFNSGQMIGCYECHNGPHPWSKAVTVGVNK